MYAKEQNGVIFVSYPQPSYGPAPYPAGPPPQPMMMMAPPEKKSSLPTIAGSS